MAKKTSVKERQKQFQESIVLYYERDGRHDLPWRKTKDPWLIMLAEMLLRKTAAVQVQPVYLELSTKSPNEIALMSLSDLEILLNPLGIYKERAVLIKQAAEIASDVEKEKFRSTEFLGSIKGVGPYNINAVLCFAFGEPKPALDRNMIRILDRVFSLKSEKSRPHTDKLLWEKASLFVPIDNPKDYNWGVLDLSSALCRPNSPKCSHCPLNAVCDYSNSLTNKT